MGSGRICLLCDWLVALSVTALGSSRVVAAVRVSFLYKVTDVALCGDTALRQSIHPSVDTRGDHLLAAVPHAAATTGVQIPLCVSAFSSSGYIPRMAGSPKITL